jgi:hypothetical protein
MTHRLACLLLAAMVAACGGSETGPVGAASSGSGGAIVPPEPPDAGLGAWLCQPGELELEDGSCLPAGIRPEDCSPGFEPTGDSSCAPILPASCPPGLMAVPGETECREVAPCAPGTWGDIPVEPSTVYVDASFGGASDGTAAAPFTTIQAGVDAATDGAIVAVAPGTYAEKVTIGGKRVRLWGRCPGLVGVVAADNTVSVGAGASQTEIRDIAVVGDAVALHVDTSLDVLIDRVWIHASGIIGLDVEGSNPSVRLTRSLIETTTNIGVFGYGVEVTVEDSVFRDIDSSMSANYGHAFRVFADQNGVPTHLTVRRSVVERAHDAAVVAGAGSTVVVEDSVIRDIAEEAATGLNGYGVYGFHATLTVTGSYVDGSHSAGIIGHDSDITVERTVVRNVALADAGPPLSLGIAILSYEDLFEPNMLTVRSVVVEGTRFSGIQVENKTGLIEAALVRDTEELGAPFMVGVPDVFGRGIVTLTSAADVLRASVVVRGSRVERVHEAAVVVLGADADIDGLYCADVAYRSTDGRLGRCLEIQVTPGTFFPADATVRRSLIERAHENAIAVLESSARLEAVWIRDTSPAADGLAARGVVVQGHYYAGLPADAAITRSLVEGSTDGGIMSFAADVSVEHSVVRDTVSAATADAADGIVITAYDPGDLGMLARGSLDVRSTVVENSERAGVAVFASEVRLEDTWLSCNLIDLDGETFDLAPYEFVDLGGNTCLCGTEVRVCKVLSSDLAPPSPVGF